MKIYDRAEINKALASAYLAIDRESLTLSSYFNVTTDPHLVGNIKATLTYMFELLRFKPLGALTDLIKKSHNPEKPPLYNPERRIFCAGLRAGCQELGLKTDF